LKLGENLDFGSAGTQDPNNQLRRLYLN